MTVSWSCLEGCPTTPGDTWAANDREAEKHTKVTGHATLTSTVGARRVRDEKGVRDVGGGGST